MRSVWHSDRLHIFGILTSHIRICLDEERSFPMKEQTTSCRSVFKNGQTPDAKDYTQIWITLINQMEHSKAVLAGIKK